MLLELAGAMLELRRGERNLQVILGIVTQVTEYVLGLSYLFTLGPKQLGSRFTCLKGSTLWFILQGGQANA